MESLFRGCFQESTAQADTGLTVYIAGPISGDLRRNLPEFFKAENNLRAAGHRTFNPARADGGVTAAECLTTATVNLFDRDWSDYMRLGLRGLLRSDAIALLPGWTHSKGAVLEYQVASALGMHAVCPEAADLIPMGVE